jgi:hypothetical protein
MLVNRENLTLEIHGKNELTRIILEQLTHVYPQLEKFVGKKINTQSGKSAKFIIDFKEIPAKLCKLTENNFAQNQGCYFNITNYSIYLNFKLCFNGGKYEDKTYYCRYFERSVYLGEMDNATLKNLTDLNELINDLYQIINIDEEQAKLNKYHELKDKLEAVRTTIKVDSEFYKYL